MNRSSWLEISETCALFLVGLGAIITLASDNLLFIVVPMVATLILNKINRQDKEKQIYHKTLGKLEHLQTQVWSELQSLQELILVLQEHEVNNGQEEKITNDLIKQNQEIKHQPSLNGNGDQNHYQELIEDYEEYILSLEESLNNVIQYLNQAGINQRFEQLEEYYEQISHDVAHLTRKLNYTSELAAQKDSHSSPLLLFGQNQINNQSNIISSEDTIDQIEQIDQIQIEQINQLVESSNNKDLDIITPIKIDLPKPNLEQKWEKLFELSAHENGITDLIISPDNYFIATVSLDQNLKIWSLTTGELLHSNLAHEKGILALTCQQEYSPQNQLSKYTLATGGFDYKIKLWEFSTDQIENFNLSLEYTLNGHLGSIRALKFTPDGQILISGSYDKTVKQWGIKDGNLIQNSFDDLSSIQSLAVSYDGKIIASGGEDGKIYFWEAKTGIKRGCLQGNDQSVKALDLSGNGQFLVAGCSDGSLKLWQLESSIFREGKQPNPSKILTEHFGEIKAVIFSPCGQFLISADTYGTILIWSVNSGEILNTLSITQESEGEQIRLLSLSLSQDGKYLVAGDVKGNLSIWQIN